MSTLIKRTVRGTELGERGLHEEESGDKKLSREMSSPLQKKEAAGKKGYCKTKGYRIQNHDGHLKRSRKKGCVDWLRMENCAT